MRSEGEQQGTLRGLFWGYVPSHLFVFLRLGGKGEEKEKRGKKPRSLNREKRNARVTTGGGNISSAGITGIPPFPLRPLAACWGGGGGLVIFPPGICVFLLFSVVLQWGEKNRKESESESEKKRLSWISSLLLTYQ